MSRSWRSMDETANVVAISIQSRPAGAATAKRPLVPGGPLVPRPTPSSSTAQRSRRRFDSMGRLYGSRGTRGPEVRPFYPPYGRPFSCPSMPAQRPGTLIVCPLGRGRAPIEMYENPLVSRSLPRIWGVDFRCCRVETRLDAFRSTTAGARRYQAKAPRTNLTRRRRSVRLPQQPYEEVIPMDEDRQERIRYYDLCCVRGHLAAPELAGYFQDHLRTRHGHRRHPAGRVQDVPRSISASWSGACSADIALCIAVDRGALRWANTWPRPKPCSSYWWAKDWSRMRPAGPRRLISASWSRCPRARLLRDGQEQGGGRRISPPGESHSG